MMCLYVVVVPLKAIPPTLDQENKIILNSRTPLKSHVQTVYAEYLLRLRLTSPYLPGEQRTEVISTDPSDKFSGTFVQWLNTLQAASFTPDNVFSDHGCFSQNR